MINLLPNLDTWLATDNGYPISGVDTLFVYYKKPEKRETAEGHIFFAVQGNTTNYARIFSAKFFNLQKDYSAYKLYVSKNRHKKNIRTFWLTSLGYKKYLITNYVPIKNNNPNKNYNNKFFYLKNEYFSGAALLIDKAECGINLYNRDSEQCRFCPKSSFCKKIQDKHYFYSRKIYFYFIKNNKKIYL